MACPKKSKINSQFMFVFATSGKVIAQTDCCLAAQQCMILASTLLSSSHSAMSGGIQLWHDRVRTKRINKYFEGFQPEWYISTLYLCRNIAFWLETHNLWVGLPQAIKQQCGLVAVSQQCVVLTSTPSLFSHIAILDSIQISQCRVKISRISQCYKCVVSNEAMKQQHRWTSCFLRAVCVWYKPAHHCSSLSVLCQMVSRYGTIGSESTESVKIYECVCHKSWNQLRFIIMGVFVTSHEMIT